MDCRKPHQTLSQQIQDQASRLVQPGEPCSGFVISMSKDEYAKFILQVERLENTARKSVVRKKAVTAQNNALALANRLRNEAIQGRLDAEKSLAELSLQRQHVPIEDPFAIPAMMPL